MTVMQFNEAGQFEGGIYEKVEVTAEVIVSSSIEAHEIIVTREGSLTIQGKLNAPYIHVEGKLTVEDTIETNEMTIDSTAEVAAGNNVIATNVENKGKFKLNEGLRTAQLHSKGVLVARGPVNAEQFKSTGSIQLDNDLTAQDIEIIVAESSNIRYVNGGNVTVKAEREKLLFKDTASKLSVRELDGKEVAVENVVADIVRGSRVVIHNNCTIKTVEYEEDYTYDESSDVYEFAKIKR